MIYFPKEFTFSVKCIDENKKSCFLSLAVPGPTSSDIRKKFPAEDWSKYAWSAWWRLAKE